MFSNEVWAVAWTLVAATPLMAQQKGKPLVVPARYDEDRFYAAPVTKTGSPLLLFTDTGGGLFLSEEAVQRLNLPVREAQIDGRKVIAASLPPLSSNASFPPVTATNGLFPVVPVAGDDPGNFLFRGADGLLGQAWFRDRVWTFDYPGRCLLLRAPNDLPAHAPEHAVRLGFQTDSAGGRATNYPRIQVRISDELVDLLFDTGASTHLTGDALAKLKDGRPAVRATSFITASVLAKWHAKHPDWRIIESAENGSGQLMIEVPQLKVAGHTVGPVWFTRRPDKNFHEWMSQWMDKRIEGALGGNALRHFRVTVDYPNAVAVFEKPTGK